MPSWPESTRPSHVAHAHAGYRCSRTDVMLVDGTWRHGRGGSPLVPARSHSGPQGLVDVMVGGQVDGLPPSCLPGQVDHDFVGPMALQFRHRFLITFFSPRPAGAPVPRSSGL